MNRHQSRHCAERSDEPIPTARIAAVLARDERQERSDDRVSPS
jgi:hypothetical protein